MKCAAFELNQSSAAESGRAAPRHLRHEQLVAPRREPHERRARLAPAAGARRAVGADHGRHVVEVRAGVEDVEVDEAQRLRGGRVAVRGVAGGEAAQLREHEPHVAPVRVRVVVGRRVGLHLLRDPRNVGRQELGRRRVGHGRRLHVEPALPYAPAGDGALEVARGPGLVRVAQGRVRGHIERGPAGGVHGVVRGAPGERVGATVTSSGRDKGSITVAHEAVRGRAFRSRYPICGGHSCHI